MRLESPDQIDAGWATFSPDRSHLVVTTNNPPCVQVWDLRIIGRELKAINLAWDLPENFDPGEGSTPTPLRVEMVGSARAQSAPKRTLEAPLKASAPSLDGRIGPEEYGPVYDVRFDDAGNPGRLYALTGTRSKTADDYSYRLRAAHTVSALYVAFEVRDQDVQVNPQSAASPNNNDCIELFIDADHVANDLTAVNHGGNREGFQIVADADGNQYTLATDLTNSDWKVCTRRIDGGFVMEFEIPLRALDTEDGPGNRPADRRHSSFQRRRQRRGCARRRFVKLRDPLVRQSSRVSVQWRRRRLDRHAPADALRTEVVVRRPAGPQTTPSAGSGLGRFDSAPPLSAPARLVHNTSYGSSQSSDHCRDDARPGCVRRTQLLALSRGRLLGHPGPECHQARGHRLSLSSSRRRSPSTSTLSLHPAGPCTSHTGDVSVASKHIGLISCLATSNRAAQDLIQGGAVRANTWRFLNSSGRNLRATVRCPGFQFDQGGLHGHEPSGEALVGRR